MKLERSDVSFPLWRKKVDSSLFNYKGTTIPGWACNMWDIQEQFIDCTTRKNPISQVKILLNNTEFDGWVTIAKEGRKKAAYRLWFSDDLLYCIKDVFLMSYMRDIEYRLRKDSEVNIEEEIPFWEFLDIEYDSETKTFIFKAHYTQRPSFPALFQRMIGSSKLHKIDDELENKHPFRIYKQDWKAREELDFEIEVDNVLYFLIDTDNKLLYVGEAGKLVKRLKQNHPTIRNWNYYRYDVLPDHLSKKEYRVALERMLIRDYAALLENKKGINYISISDYCLANDKIDLR